MITLEHGTLEHGNTAVLRGIALDLHEGEVTCVLGMNGAGKSSLLSILCGERELDAGQVIFAGKPLHAWSRRELARRRAVLPQHASMAFPMSVEDIVMMGRAPHHMSGLRDPRERDYLNEVLEEVNLSGFLGRAYNALSGGERQRVQLARVLMQLAPLDESLGGKWLFLDEPTASQDVSRAHDILRLSRRLSRSGLGVCVVVHDLNLALRYADRVVVLRRGEVLCDGTPQAVLTPDCLKEGFEIDARVEVLRCGTPLLVVHSGYDVQMNKESRI